jgi:hypothetical protein
VQARHDPRQRPGARWQRWTPLRAILALVMLVYFAVGGYFLGAIFGGVSISGDYPLSTRVMFAAGLSLSTTGPLLLWHLRQRRGWLLVALAMVLASVWIAFLSPWTR